MNLFNINNPKPILFEDSRYQNLPYISLSRIKDIKNIYYYNLKELNSYLTDNFLLRLKEDVVIYTKKYFFAFRFGTLNINNEIFVLITRKNNTLYCEYSEHSGYSEHSEYDYYNFSMNTLTKIINKFAKVYGIKYKNINCLNNKEFNDKYSLIFKINLKDNDENYQKLITNIFLKTQ